MMNVIHHRFAVLAAIVAAAIVAVGAPRLVRADCASPFTALSPAPDSVVPPNPTLYMFVPHWREKEHEAVTAHAGSAELPVTMRRLDANDTFVAYAITVETGDARAFDLRLATGPGASEAPEAPEARYHIDPSWVAPAERRARPVAAVHIKDHWTCSFNDLWELSIDGAAPALRVEWATSKAAFARGAATVATFPDQPKAFWRGHGRAVAKYLSAGKPDQKNSSPVVALGHGSCFGYTIPTRVVQDRGFADGKLFVRVTPLYADGSAGEPGDIVRVSDLPRPRERPASETDEDEDFATDEPVAVVEPVAEVSATVIEAPSPRPFAMASRVWALAVASGVLLGLALVLGWRRGRARRVAALAAVAAPACAGLALLAGVTAWPAWLASAAVALGLPVLVAAAARRRPDRG
jgi:hypothetical protein